ncbi:CaiB/BaiF CoA-transferase family protein [Arthrobacter sp. ISL-72]|uniref:CaiB/BaiF CoA transferase family protein n=1 Tax=Arthrobacter sp. ISL-72 TaxID=2819114 RepID=UPI001BE7626F|nr:CoA transferase [Arthrobacter sp. ISL-72]MBT2597872.1 CoA transferase [Arthrobacter sp. ISL-72]
MTTTAGSSETSAGEILPLSGVKIVDLSQIGAGPYGTSMLGDLGADVIKVEPLQGDSFRYVDNAYAPGESAYFYGVNRSKRSIALNLKDPAGYEVLMRLIREADVFVVAFRPDAVERMGIDYATLSKVNPRMVYASITAFGEEGPRSHQPGMDILAQALSGMMGVTGEVGGGPVKVGVPIADFVGSFFLGFGVCAALRQRDQTGQGDKISINLLDGQVAAFANYITAYDKTRVAFRPQGGGHPQLVPYQPFLGSDDKYFILACLNDRFWIELVPFLAEFDDFSDPRFATNTDRIAHREELCGRLQDLFSTQPADFWLQKLEQAGIPCSPIHRMEEALEDPQVVHNQSVVELEHPRFGAYKVPNNPIRFQKAGTGPRGYAPGLGEHTEEILSEAGLNPEEIQSLRAAGIINSTFTRQTA